MKNYSSYLSLIVLLISSSVAYPMLLLRQEKKQRPAYLCLKQRKLDKDPLIPQGKKREGFEQIITFGKVLVDNSGTIMKAAQTAASMVVVNIASQIVTGKSWGQISRERQERREYDHNDQYCHDDYEEEDVDAPEDRGSTEKVCKWDATRECFIDPQGNVFRAITGPSEKPQDGAIYTGFSLPTHTTPQTKDESIVSMPEPNMQDVDYDKNPIDTSWLKEFAQKICPSGKYVVGDIIAHEEDSGIVLAATPPMPNFNPQDPEDDKHKKSERIHKLGEVAEESLGHYLGERALEKIAERECEEEEHKKHASHQKVPNYDSGKRLENWKNNHDATHPKEKKEPSKSWGRRMAEAREEEKSLESVKEEPQQAPILVKYDTKTRDSVSKVINSYSEPKVPSSTKSTTNASTWDYDFSKSQSTTSSYSHTHTSSSSSTSSRDISREATSIAMRNLTKGK